MHVSPLETPVVPTLNTNSADLSYASLPTIDVKVNKTKFRALLDSGSSINLISADLIPQLNCKFKVDKCDLNVQNFTGSFVKIQNVVKMHFFLKDQNFSQSFYVVHNLGSSEYSMILGTPFLQENKFSIDFHNQCLYKDNLKISFTNSKNEEFINCNVCFNTGETNLYSSRKYIIPPNSEKTILVRSHKLINSHSDELFIQPFQKFWSNGLLIGRNINKRNKDNIYPLIVMNFNNEPYHINKNSKLAFIECIEKTPTLECNSVEQTLEDVDFCEADITYDHLDCEAQQKLKNFLENYKDCFAKGIKDLTGCDTLLHRIELLDQIPVRQKPYKTPHHLKGELHRQVNELLEHNIIKNSTSPYAAPVILVKKKDGSYRLCVDFRKLNIKTLPDSFPIPNITELVDNLSGSFLFSSVDLCQGFNQMQINARDTYKTAFITDSGLYEWNRVPFGLKNSPNSFQRLMQLVLSGLKPYQIGVYLDDIIIASKDNIDEHLEKLGLVFDRLRLHNLKLKPSKCKFLMKQIKYLGFQIGNGKVLPDESNVSVIDNFKIPTTKSEVKSFLGVVGFYRRFIPNFAEKALPLTQLTKEKTTFNFNQRALDSFHELKNSLKSYPCLYLPNFEEEFVLSTDASKYSLGAVLSQYDENKFLHPVAYASRKLKGPEINYSTVEKELLGIVYGVSYFKQYLLGKRFTIFCDQASLSHTLKLKDPTSRIARWVMTLQQYDYQVIHKPGRLNLTADYLSRGVEINNLTLLSAQPTLLEKIKSEQQNDPFCSKIKNELENNINQANHKYEFFVKNHVLYCKPKSKIPNITYKDKLVIPKSVVPEILSLCHDSPTISHQGFHKTLRRIKLEYFWPRMYTHILNYIKSCNSCNERRAHIPSKLAPLQRMPIASKPMEYVAVDAMGPFPMSYSGNKYLLVMSDYFTRWPEAYPTPDIKSDTVARVLEKFIARHGVPNHLISDRGSNFLSKSISEVYKRLGILKHSTSPYHPQSDGVVEKLNGTLINALCHLVNETHTDWDRHVEFALMAHRSSTHTTTGFSPSQVLYGREIALPHNILTGEPVKSYCEIKDYTYDLNQRLKKTYEMVQKHLIQAAEGQEKYRLKFAKQKKLKVNDSVYLYEPNVKPGLSRKLSKPNKGPFVITKILSPVNIEIKLKDNNKVVKRVHIDRVKRVEERLPDILSNPVLEENLSSPEVPLEEHASSDTLPPCRRRRPIVYIQRPQQQVRRPPRNRRDQPPRPNHNYNLRQRRENPPGR